MAFRSSATFRRYAAGVIGEEIPMVGLGIGVVVTVGRGHEGDIITQEIRRVVISGCVQRPDQNPDAQQVQGVFTGPHSLVIVGVGPAPK